MTQKNNLPAHFQGKTHNNVILHLGVHKTGTSSIQRSLWAAANRNELLEQGVYFPLSLNWNHSEFFHSAFSDSPEQYHTNKARGESRVEIVSRVARQQLRLSREISGLNGYSIVFSGEDGSILTERGLARLRDYLEKIIPKLRAFDVIVYTRHPVSYVGSAVQENVKGNQLTLEFARDWHISVSEGRYGKLWERLKNVFGSENVHFRAFENAKKKTSGVVGDFADLLGLCVDSIDIKTVNTSISDEVVRVLSYFNEHKIDLPESDRIKLLGLPGQRGTLLSIEHVLKLLSITESDREFLASRFGIYYGNDAKDELDEWPEYSQGFIQELAVCFTQLSEGTVTELKRLGAL